MGEIMIGHAVVTQTNSSYKSLCLRILAIPFKITTLYDFHSHFTELTARVR